MSQEKPDSGRDRKPTFTSFQGYFILVGIALIVVGFNSVRPLIIVGAVLIGLAVFSSWSGRA